MREMVSLKIDGILQNLMQSMHNSFYVLSGILNRTPRGLQNPYLKNNTHVQRGFLKLKAIQDAMEAEMKKYTIRDLHEGMNDLLERR